MRRRIGVGLAAACLAFAVAVIDGVLNSSVAAQASAVPGTPLLTATPPSIATPQPAANTAAAGGASYVGSRACQRCHAATYERWSHTRMANVITDPKVNPRAVLGDFSTPNPLVTFTIDDVAFVYGTKWKQRYFIRKGSDYYPANAQWDITNKLWRAYFVQPNTDWWTTYYPAAAGDNTGRPTGPLCDGCHSTNFDAATRQTTEWNVGCERCHGPGSSHAAKPSRANIIDPARLDHVSASDTCIQCHSQGQPLKNPIAGQMHDWPVGFHMGSRLKDFWKLEEHHLGEASFTHFPDGTAHKNRMQGNDFVQSAMYTKGVTCASCHDVHGTAYNADLIKPADQLCLTCHGPSSPNGPRGATVEAHTHHPAGSRGSDCVECHMPKIEQTIANINVRSHTFKFITPLMSETYKIPNPCIVCHTGQTNEWATEQLKTWNGVSPWRIQ